LIYFIPRTCASEVSNGSSSATLTNLLLPSLIQTVTVDAEYIADD